MARKKKHKYPHLNEGSVAPEAPRPAIQPEPVASAPTLSTLQDRILLGITVGFSLLIYWYTMWPTVGGGDAGELIGASYTLGVIHPPGYPLFIWFGKIFSYLPFGTVAWRIGWVSVLSSVAAHAFYFLALRRLTQNSVVAFFTTTLLAFSTLIWRYSIIAEVFSLNSFFVSLLLYLFTRFCAQPSTKLACLMAFAFGLGLSNHHTLVFFGLPMAAWMLFFYREQLLKPQMLLLLALSGLLGLFPYLHLFWASAKAPLISWGDISSWQGFLTHFMRKEYGTFQLASDGSQKLQLFYGLAYYFQNLMEHALYLGIIPIGYALWRLFSGLEGLIRRQLGLILFIGAFYLFTFHYLANLPYVEGAALYKDIVSRFWIMGHIIFFVFLAFGLSELLKKFPLEGKLLLLLFGIAIFMQIGLNFKTENQRDNWTFDRFGRYLLSPLPPNSLFFTLGDINTNTVRYLQNCENFRTDVRVLDRSLMSYPWYKRIITKHYPDVVLPGLGYHPDHPRAHNFDRLFTANFDKFPIYATFIKTSGALEASDKSMENKWKTVPYGLSLRVVRKETVLNIEEYITESQKFIVDPFEEFAQLPAKDSWDAVVKSNYWLANHMRAAEILKYAMENNFPEKYLRLAADLLADLIQRNPSPAADYYKNHGLAHHHLARVGPPAEKAEHEKEMIKSWRVFIERTERRDKLYEQISAILKAYKVI